MNALTTALRDAASGALFHLIAWACRAYVHCSPDAVRVVVTITSESEESETPPPPQPGCTDPTYVEWLNEVYRNSPSGGDTRMG